MTFKEHCKKRDRVYYLAVFVGFVVGFTACSLLIDNMSWLAALTGGVISAIVFTLLMAVFNHASDDVDAAVKEDKNNNTISK